MVADMIRYLIAGVLTFATGIVIGYRPGGGVLGVAMAILLGVIAGWSLAWIFTWFGTVGKSAQSVQGYSLMVMFPLTFLSNAFVPADTLPGWLETFTKVNPVTHVVTALRDLANTGNVTAEVGWALLGCFAVIAIFAPLVGARVHEEDVTGPTRCSRARVSSTRSVGDRSAYSAIIASRRPGFSRAARAVSEAQAITGKLRL